METNNPNRVIQAPVVHHSINSPKLIHFSLSLTLIFFL